jgi:uncharacterized protein YraI
MFGIRQIVLGSGLLLALGVGAANAASGYATATVNLRAGPGTQYPAVSVIRAGEPVQIYGCLSGYSWCDVYAHGFRGWSAGRYLQVIYQSRRVPILGYGRYVAVPFIGFNLNLYWNQNYRNRTFYRDLPRFGGNFNNEPPHNNNGPRYDGGNNGSGPYIPGNTKPRDDNGPRYNGGTNGSGPFIPGNNNFTRNNNGPSNYKGPGVTNGAGGNGPGTLHCPPGTHPKDGMCVR